MATPSHRKAPAAPSQGGLFGTQLPCEDMGNLPLILEPRGGIEVLAPGSIYQPLLLKSASEEVEVGPGWLNSPEEAFVRDLIKYLYPAGNHPKSLQSPLRWGEREIWLKRNLDKRDDSFRLRLDDSDWFYPDFIVWILDHASRTQTFGFVDPKGFAMGIAGGWSDYKVLSTLYMPHVVERQLAARGERVSYLGQEWAFRVRGVLLSNTPYASLSRHDKFNLNGETGGQLPPGEADFRRGRILFQRQDSSCSHYSPNNPDRPNNPGGHYISAVLDLLTTDSRIDRLMARIACLYDPQARFVPADEIDFDLALRYMESPRAETEFVADVLRDYLRPSVSGEVGHLARERRRGQLLHYSHEGVLGFGAEKAYAIRDLPNPCEELWRRKGATSLQV